MKQRNSSKFGLVVAGLGALMIASTAPRSAEACGGEWFPVIEVDHRPIGIARAEKALEKGDKLAAAGMIIRMMPHIKTLDAKRSTLVARAQRVLAVATARSNGALGVADQVPSYAQDTWIGKSAEHRTANLEWSISALRAVDETKKEDPAVQSDLAEALSKVDAHRGEARKILEKLAKKDLIPTPEGYAVLAELRSRAGDQAGKKLALKRCAAIAPDSAVCRASAES